MTPQEFIEFFDKLHGERIRKSNAELAILDEKMRDAVTQDFINELYNTAMDELWAELTRERA